MKNFALNTKTFLKHSPQTRIRSRASWLILSLFFLFFAGQAQAQCEYSYEYQGVIGGQDAYDIKYGECSPTAELSFTVQFEGEIPANASISIDYNGYWLAEEAPYTEDITIDYASGQIHFWVRRNDGAMKSGTGVVARLHVSTNAGSVIGMIDNLDFKTRHWDQQAEEALESNLELWPNPASEIINIKASFPLSSLSLVNLQGQVVLQKPLNQAAGQSETLELNGLQSGIYILQANGENQKIQKRIMVK